MTSSKNQNGFNFFNDLKSTNYRKDITREYRELKDFYLDDEKKEKLKKMGRVERFIYQTGYLFASIFQKLTPIRKFLVVAGLFLMFFGNNIQIDNQNPSSGTTFLGGLIIFFVLVLELKDKLLAVEELIAGKNIQRALMPVESPQIEGWDVFLFTSSANEVSGDLVDYLKLDDNRSVITIADVAGKGLSAALLTTKLQSTIRAYAETSDSPAELTLKTNKIFNRDSLPNLFASMIYLEISSDSNTIRFANAGHFPPAILSGGDLTEMEKGDAALGILPNCNYRNFEISLNTDNIFVSYSDGITEAKNELGWFYGREKLFELLKTNQNLSAAELGKRIIYSVDRFRGEAKISDDISIIILKKK